MKWFQIALIAWVFLTPVLLAVVRLGGIQTLKAKGKDATMTWEDWWLTQINKGLSKFPLVILLSATGFWQ